MTSVEFTPENKSRFEKTVAKYEQAQSALMPTLYIAQEQFGFLSPPVLDYVAKLLNIPVAHAYEVVSFYGMYKKKDMGRYCLQVCNNVTCTMRGSEDLLAVVKEELGLSPNEMTADKKFSLINVQCLGSCDTAPVVQVNEDYVEKLNPQKFREYLRKLKGTSTAQPEETVTP